MRIFFKLFLFSFFLIVLEFIVIPSFSSPASAQFTGCWITKIGNPSGPSPTFPPDCAASGDAVGLARQILAMPDKIILLNRSRDDIQAVIDNKKILNDSSCFQPVTVHPELLKVMVQLGQKHSYTVWNIISGHFCDRFYHPLGRAMDIGLADGRNSWQNASFRQDAADVLPSGGTLLQTYCPGTPQVTPKRKLIQGADGCNHQHMDVGIDIK